MKHFVNELRISVVLTAALAVLVCGLYPLAVFVAAQGLFPGKANGSIVYHNGSAVGSDLLGQAFKSPQYLHPRPSAAGNGYDTMASGGSNLGPTSKVLIEKTRKCVDEYRNENGLSREIQVPADAVMASASGLDPHISVENALLQASRIAKARGVPPDVINEEIRKHTEGRALGVLGEPRVNVLQTNLALDRRAAAGK